MKATALWVWVTLSVLNLAAGACELFTRRR
jgi:hypothetical protein